MARVRPATASRHPRRGRGVILGAAGVVAALVLGLLIVRTDGYAATSVQPDPQSVWVTNGADLLVGRVNTQIDELDSAALIESNDSDLLQDGRSVAVVDTAAHRVRSLNVATVTLGPPVPIPADAAVALAGDRLAVADRVTGSVWIAPLDDLTESSFTDAAPAFAARAGVTLAGAVDGTVAAVAPGDTAAQLVPPGSTTPRRIRLGGAISRPTATAPQDSGAADQPGAGPAGTAAHPPLSVTLLGDTPVVLDATAGRIVTPQRSIALPGGATDAVLQLPGAAADSVLAETTTALLRIPLAGGPVQRFDSGITGSPTAPVWLDGCAHAAWSGARPSYLRWCGSTPVVVPIPNASTDTAAGNGRPAGIVFRVNGSTIVLNDVATGNIWVADRSMVLINNWDQVAPQRTASVGDTTDDTSDSKSTTLTLSRTDCSGAPAPPSARPDTFGVRAGRPTILPVMANDSVSDCSVTTIDSVSALPPDVGTVTVVDGGTALQVVTDADATGQLPTVTYRLSDGLGHAAQATVSLHIAAAGSTAPPTKIRDSAVVVALGGTATTNVLSDWISPDGDALFLAAARSDDPGETVSASPDGTITVHDPGTGTPGKHTVTFSVSDGTDSTQGTLTVQVLATTDPVPVPSPVYARATTGTPVTIYPLATVLSIGPDPLQLTAVTRAPGVPQPAGLTAVPDSGSGSLTVTAERPGTYYLDFQVAAGSQTATGVIRVDVAAPGDDPTPLPVLDTAYLPQGGTTRVDLTANDAAPSGEVLAVQQISLDDDSPLTVTMADMHVATISANAALPPAGVWFSYTVIGSGPPATGWVHVVGVPPDDTDVPVASPISLTVRAGDAATVSVDGDGSGLGSARDPGGSALTVAAFPPLHAGSGLLFAAGPDIRYLAPARGSDAPIDTSYTVTNTQHRSASAPLRIHVVPAGTNHPPRTPAVTTARVFAGDSVTVALPLDGIDPDGDWAIATGIADPPAAGTAVIAGPAAVRYTAPDRPGPETFDYTVTDPSGARSTGTVVVGVIARPGVVAPPIAPDLTATVAPGGTASIDVLGAVSDPSGSGVGFADPALAGPSGAGVRGHVDGTAVVVTAGRSVGVVPLTYTVRNAAGLTASGVITVTVSPDAPKVPPVARDAYVTAAMVSADHTTATVDVAGLVSNPGGRPEDLTLGVPAVDGSAASKAGPMSVRVTLTGGRQVLAYQVRNAAGLTASAFIVVPGRDEIAAGSGAGGIGRGATRPTSGVSAPTSGAGAGAATGGRTTPTSVPPSPPTSAAVEGRTGTSPATSATTAPPPPLISDLQVRLAAGATSTVQLTGMVRDAGRYPHLTFGAPKGADGAISASLRGSVLTVTAAPGVPAGSTTDLTVTVSDGVHAVGTGTVAVTVIATTAPRPTLPSRQVTASQGRPVTVDMLAGASNPLSARGPLRLTAAQVTSGDATVHFQPGGTVTVTPAVGGTGTVTVLVTATDPAGRSAAGNLTVTVLGRPDPPSGVTVTGIGHGSVTLTWAAPDDHGAAITDYLVGATGVSVDCGTRTTCTVTGLTDGQPYEFRVRARNRVGESDWSAPVSATPDVVPAAPGKPTALVGNGRLQFTWTAPRTAGSPIDHYRVSISPAPLQGSSSLSTTATSVTFGRLRNGTAYTLTVAAVNESGGTGPSSVSAPATPMATPGAPGTPRLSFDQSGGANTIDVTWAAPANDGGYRDLTYTVHWSAAGKTGTVNAATARSATIRGVTLGNTYTVWVRAANPAGSSPDSTRATITPTTAPQQVTNLAAKPTGAAGTVALTWRAPANGGSPISSYQIRYHAAGGSFGAWAATGSAATSRNVTRLTNGSDYTFQVRACNGASSCGQASPAASANPYAPPGAIGNLSASGTGTSGQVSATWSRPSTGGRAIDRYQYRYRKGNGAYTGWQNSPSGAATSLTVGGFTDGATYTFQVRAVTAVQPGDPQAGTHTGPPSNADPATPCRPPDAMAAPTGTNITQTKITLHWKAPFNGGRPITKFQFRKGSGAWTDAGSGTSHTVTGLRANTGYAFRVRACNAFGCGTASPSRTIRTAKPAPTASVRLVHGPRYSGSGCSGSCYYLGLKYQNLKSGNYTVCFHFDKQGPGCWRSYSHIHLAGSGTWSTESIGPDYARYGYRTKGTVKVSGPVTVTSPSFNW